MQFYCVSCHDLNKAKHTFAFFYFLFYVSLLEGGNALSYDRITHKDIYVKALMRKLKCKVLFELSTMSFKF